MTAVDIWLSALPTCSLIFMTEYAILDFIGTPRLSCGKIRKEQRMNLSAWLAAGILSVSLLTLTASAAALPEGWLLWHSYSEYSALDSRLYLRAPSGAVQQITGDFIHAMNGSFGSTPDQIVFMAIDSAADEWDIFRYDAGTITNLTKNSGFRNEDPKWSPDCGKIVFKRGHWDSAADDFVYDLALLDPAEGIVTMLTDDRAEQAMPCFSSDGSTLYYAEYSDGIGTIRRMDLRTGGTATVFAEAGVTAYYPVAYGGRLYFTAWYSAGHHADRIMMYDGEAVSEMPFDSASYDCSDACPFGGGMLYSSTQQGSYDLCYFDGEQSVPLDALNTGLNELGACFFASVRGDINADGICDAADAAALQSWLLTIPDTTLPQPHAADLDHDGRLNAADLTMLRRILLP